MAMARVVGKLRWAGLVVLCAGLIGAGGAWAQGRLARQILPAAPPISRPTERVTHSLLQTGPLADYNISSSGMPSISPDERWLVFSPPRQEGKPESVIFHNLQDRQTWQVNAEHSDKNMLGFVAAWRSDSRACAVALGGDWLVAEPGVRRVTQLGRREWEEVAAGWSPKRKLLAFFDTPDFRVWDGRRVSEPVNWAERLGYPSLASPWRAWDCEWSPDEKFILLRFYGAADRTKESPGHLEVINPTTVKKAGGWGGEGINAHWLDSARIIFLSDNDATRTSYTNMPLVVQARGRKPVRVLPQVGWYALSGNRRFIWAWRSGSLYRIDSRTLKRRVVMKSVADCAYSEARDLLWVLTKEGATHIIDSKTLAKRFIGRWSKDDRPSDWRVLGWAKGKPLPLLLVRQGNSRNAPEIWQLEAPTAGQK